MEAFPAFFPLAGARVAIAGEGEAAEAKVRLLSGSPAKVIRLNGPAALDPTSYRGVRLAFVAGADAPFRAGAAAAARAAGAIVNVADAPELSDFHTPAVIDRGSVVAAIGTGGTSPMLAALLRAELEGRISTGLGPLAALLGERREAIRAAFADLGERRAFLRAVLEGPVAEAAMAGDTETAGERLDAAIRAGVKVVGKVWLIQPPPARDLLSLRAARALAVADLLVVGEGVEEEVLTLARRDAGRRSLAKADDGFLATAAGEGRLVAIVARPEDFADQLATLRRLRIAHEVLAPALASGPG